MLGAPKKFKQDRNSYTPFSDCIISIPPRTHHSSSDSSCRKYLRLTPSVEVSEDLLRAVTVGGVGGPCEEEEEEVQEDGRCGHRLDGWAEDEEEEEEGCRAMQPSSDLPLPLLDLSLKEGTDSTRHLGWKDGRYSVLYVRKGGGYGREGFSGLGGTRSWMFMSAGVT